MAQAETRLEKHRREFDLAKGVGPLLRIDDLDFDEIRLINADFLERCKGKVEDIGAIYTAYVQTLHAWGVMCPHPQPQRLYNGFQLSDAPLQYDEAAWFDCQLCKAAVINK